MSQDLLDVAKGRAAMTYEQYVALLKCKAHELDGAEKSTGVVAPRASKPSTRLSVMVKAAEVAAAAEMVADMVVEVVAKAAAADTPLKTPRKLDSS